MKRSGIISLVGILLVTIVALVATLAADNRILLGIDLDGGVEVGLVPVEDTELEGEALEEALTVSEQIIRNRVDGLGVAEPDITRQGNRIVVQLPGIDDQQRALEVVGATAELRFRPVCAVLLPEPLDLDASGAEGDDAVDPNDVDGDGVRDQPFGVSPADVDVEVGEDGGIGTAPPGVGCEGIGIDATEALSLPDTDPDDEEADQPVILSSLAGDDGEPPARYLLGRTMLTGAALETADATFLGFEWQVSPVFRSGAEGIDLFNEAAAACFNATPVCPSAGLAGGPTAQLAIVLDGVVQSAPTIRTPFFNRDEISITGDFDEEEANDTALVLKFGALPIEFEDPADPDSLSTVNNVSATLGRDSLDAGVVAGIVGFAAVALYMIAYYRLLGVAAIASLVVSYTLLYCIIAFLSESRGLALTLAGVVGLVVSIGTSLDSNVVYFEHLKEDIANGRTLRSSVDRSFPVAFKTIFFANSASLIAAIILYVLTVGSVRGFALMLGLASILDLIATYFFLRPAVKLMARGQTLVDRPGLYGLPRPGSAPVRDAKTNDPVVDADIAEEATV
ncbi:MAG: protein translocase subunit SecD [Acidimicrobiales bacterium]